MPRHNAILIPLFFDCHLHIISKHLDVFFLSIYTFLQTCNSFKVNNEKSHRILSSKNLQLYSPGMRMLNPAHQGSCGSYQKSHLFCLTLSSIRISKFYVPKSLSKWFNSWTMYNIWLWAVTASCPKCLDQWQSQLETGFLVYCWTLSKKKKKRLKYSCYNLIFKCTANCMVLHIPSLS